METDTAARYQSFFTQVGAGGWEQVAQATATLLVTGKQPRSRAAERRGEHDEPRRGQE